MQNDFDRLLFFEHARKTAEDAYAQDPLDADVFFFNLLLHLLDLSIFFVSFVLSFLLLIDK